MENDPRTKLAELIERFDGDIRYAIKVGEVDPKNNLATVKTEGRRKFVGAIVELNIPPAVLAENLADVLIDRGKLFDDKLTTLIRERNLR